MGEHEWDNVDREEGAKWCCKCGCIGILTMETNHTAPEGQREMFRWEYALPLREGGGPIFSPGEPNCYSRTGEVQPQRTESLRYTLAMLADIWWKEGRESEPGPMRSMVWACSKDLADALRKEPPGIPTEPSVERIITILNTLGFDVGGSAKMLPSEQWEQIEAVIRSLADGWSRARKAGLLR